MSEHKTVTIFRENNQWRVDFPKLKVKRNQVIFWQLSPKGEKPDKAYFQFPPGVLERHAGAGDEVEYMELTSKKPKSEPLHVVDNDTIWRRSPYCYAIFIDDGFVRGTNPPPELDVGK